jgi:transcription elongation GreA/GreB family factor
VARGRYETLSVVLDEAERVDASAGAVIGHRVTLLEEDGTSVAYVLVCPGSGDPDQGWVAADSPLGSALLHAEPGDRVEIRAAAGDRFATVLSVE